MKRSVTYNSDSGAVILDVLKAAYLPQSKTLLVADLHFEKATYVQAAGHAALPAYDTLETLTRLRQVIDIYNPEHVVALGDSFHDTRAGERIAAQSLETLEEIIGQLNKFTWILGNHDPDIPEGLSGQQEDHLEIDGFLLTHLPVEPRAGQTNICGHLHPKAQVKLQRRRMSHPCFACSDSRLILPSFGAYTGGLYVTHKAIQDVMGSNLVFALTTPSGIYPIGSSV